MISIYDTALENVVHEAERPRIELSESGRRLHGRRPRAATGVEHMKNVLWALKNLLWARPADEHHTQELNELPQQLVFLIECHRSGTSMLYHLLAYTGACEYISAYDMIKYDEIVRNRLRTIGCLLTRRRRERTPPRTL